MFFKRLCLIDQNGKLRSVCRGCESKVIAKLTFTPASTPGTTPLFWLSSGQASSAKCAKCKNFKKCGITK
jgi:hypothetical protein